MKQKNLALIAVAVVCGLVAAVLTSQMNSKPKPAETVEVMVAAKEIPIGTKFTKDDVKSFYSVKKVAKDNVPEGAVATEEELVGKKLTRPLRKDDTFRPLDLSDKAQALSPPEGMTVFTFRASAETSAAGYVQPGSHVDLITSIKMQSLGAKSYVFPLMTNMLVLTIDNHTTTGGNVDQGYFNMQMVSLAVDSKQALILQAAVGRSADMRLMLRGDKPINDWEVPTEDVIWAIMSDNPKAKEWFTKKEVTEKKDEKLKLPVPKEDLTAGLELTEENIDKYFTEVEFIPPAPANSVLKLRDYKGKFLNHDIAANQFVPQSFVSKERPLGTVTAKAAMKDGDAGTSKEATNYGDEKGPVATAPNKPSKKKERVFKVTRIGTASGFKNYRWEILDSGEWKFVGEYRDESEGTGDDAKSDDSSKKEDAK